MCGIDVSITIGYEKKTAKIYLTGTGNSIGVTAGMHQGYIVKYRNGWGFSPSHADSILYTADVFVVLDLFRDAFPHLDIFKTDYDFHPYFIYVSPYRHKSGHT